jgi:peptide chain release factor 2
MQMQTDFQQLIDSSKKLFETFDVKKNEEEIKILEFELSDPEIWNNNQKATELNQNLAEKKSKKEQFENLKEKTENLEIALELKEESQIETISKKLQKIKDEIENEKFLSGKFDKKNAILYIYSGAGGVDAMDWAAMLLSMYESFCQKQNWQTSLIQLSSSEEGGVKSATLEIMGKNVYGFLKEEAGVHRLVRISPFNSGGTRETSFAMVEVLPEGLDESMDSKIELDEKDLKWDYFMSSGKGGQSVNTTYSAVRVTHLPTKLSATCQKERSQLQNKNLAIKYLTNKLAALELQKQQEFKQEFKGDLQDNSWGSQIRNYILHPYKLIKDTRSGWETSDVDKILEEGDILDIIWSVKRKGL